MTRTQALELAREGIAALNENRHGMPRGWLPDDVRLIATALLAAEEERQLLRKLIEAAGRMGDSDTIGSMVVFRDDVPSLFTDEDGQKLCLDEAVKRALAATSGEKP